METQECSGCGKAIEVVTAALGVLRCPACSRETQLRHSPSAVRRITTSGWAIASLVTGALCLGPIPIFLGVLGLNDVRHGRGAKDGAGLAWGGIVLGAMSLLGVGFFFFGMFFMVRSVQQSMVEFVPPSMMHDVAAAQVVRYEDDGAYWTGDVAGLYPSGQYSMCAGADAAPIGGGTGYAHQGYWIRAMTTDADGKPYAQDPDEDGASTTNDAHYGFCIYPQAYDEDYRWTYIFSEDGVAWRKDTGGAHVPAFPADPAAAGWERVAATLPTVPEKP